MRGGLLHRATIFDGCTVSEANSITLFRLYLSDRGIVNRDSRGLKAIDRDGLLP